MSLQDTIKERTKEAMKAKDALRLEVLRGLSAAFVNELVAQGKKPNEEIPDDLALKVLKRALKQRKEAVEQFRSGKREDLAQKEEKEAEIIKEFLPEELSSDEVKKLAEDCIVELGTNKKEDFGKLMPCLMKKLAGQADGALARDTLESLLS